MDNVKNGIDVKLGDKRFTSIQAKKQCLRNVVYYLMRTL